MSIIQNFNSLSTTQNRKVALRILEAGLEAIQPRQVMKDALSMEDDVLRIKNKKVRLSKYERVFLIGFGKGSAGIAVELSKQLGKFLTQGWVIDTVVSEAKKISFTLGTHPLPSRQNIEFTEMVLKETEGLTAKDLVLIVVCGGGSALFEAPFDLQPKQLSEVSAKLILSGANIAEINVVRKHLSKIKGGGLAKHLYPARVVGLLFSDVPGNDPSVIASGPTERATSSIKKAVGILDKYQIERSMIPLRSLTDLPKETKYFENVTNIVVLSNMTALEAMQKEAKELGYKAFIFSDRVQGDAKKIGKRLIDLTPPGKILLAGGETTLKITGPGKGGRNQTVALASMPVEDDTLIIAFGSDGIDYTHFGGALVDYETAIKSQKIGLDPALFLKEDDSTTFFEKTGDGLETDKLGSNVADLIMVLRLTQNKS